MGRECLTVVKYFRQRQEEGESYYFVMDLGDNGTFSSFMAQGPNKIHISSVSRCFLFDSTYKTNV